MTAHREPVSPNFTLDEFLPHGWDGSVPPEVLGNIIVLTDELLEPARAYIGRPVYLSSGYRPPEKNAEVGGVKESDHTKGRAADIWASQAGPETWQEATIRLFHWMRTHLAGKYGQLILEDHRIAKGRPTAIWIHVAIRSPKHTGKDDPNAVLVSLAPGKYRPYKEPTA